MVGVSVDLSHKYHTVMMLIQVFFAINHTQQMDQGRKRKIIFKLKFVLILFK